MDVQYSEHDMTVVTSDGCNCRYSAWKCFNLLSKSLKVPTKWYTTFYKLLDCVTTSNFRSYKKIELRNTSNMKNVWITQKNIHKIELSIYTYHHIYIHIQEQMDFVVCIHVSPLLALAYQHSSIMPNSLKRYYYFVTDEINSSGREL